MKSVFNKNIYPWLLSGISLLMSISAWIFFMFRNFAEVFLGTINKEWFDVMFFYFLLSLTLALTGFVFGIKQWRSSTYPWRIIVIAISITAVLLTLFVGFAVELSIILRST